MTRNTTPDARADTIAARWINGWRIAGWGALLALLLLPAIAMRFTREVNWTASDFVFAFVLLFSLGLGVELAMRIGRGAPQRLGMMAGTGGASLTVWVTGAVGIIGSENEALNFGFVLLVFAAILASVLVWFRPHAMRWIAGALALGQYGLGVAALWEMPGHRVEWGALTFFALIWGFSALCFHRAARG